MESGTNNPLALEIPMDPKNPDHAHEAAELYRFAWYSTSTVQILSREVLRQLAVLNQHPTGHLAEEARTDLANLQALLIIAAPEADKAVEAFLVHTKPTE